ncbi:MAG: hypothetical protein JWO30_3533 [Fibrobacteres bacterium]|nr:hypothetical protein [Fibrobacterota bacterium]
MDPPKEDEMSITATGLETLEKTVQKTQEWLKEIETEMEWRDRHFALQSLRAVLHALRDRLPIREAIDLGDQLPILVRGLYYESWDTSIVPVKDKKVEDFLAHIPPYFPKDSDLDPERVTRAVFQILKRHVSEGEIGHVLSNFPRALRGLWG